MFFRSTERTPISKRANTFKHAKEDLNARSSSGHYSTPEFRMSVLLARDENLNPQKELHARSPVTRSKNSSHPRDKSNAKSRDTLKLVNEKQPVTVYEVFNIFFS